MLLIIDNYDSFTYNLSQYFQTLGQDVMVVANDAIDTPTVKQLAPDSIVISPGPNSPLDSGVSVDVIQAFYREIPILGVCLGHQCIAYAFGGEIISAPEIIHGKTSVITHHKQGLFRNVPNPFQATRYHSLTVKVNNLPECFSIDAWAGETVMAISHREYPLWGLQFHPEAILTEHGLQLLQNFVTCCLPNRRPSRLG